jgi:hypothetical protein
MNDFFGHSSIHPYKGHNNSQGKKGVQLSSHFSFTILTFDLGDALEEAISFTNPFFMSKETQSLTIIP